MRDADFRRWLFIDELEADYALVVDGLDVLCLQQLPELPVLLRGGVVAAVVEHFGSRYLAGGLYTGNFVNAGVTIWDIRRSKLIREEVVKRGRTQFRNYVDDQLCLNEVIFTKYLEDLIILPCVHNYRAFIRRKYAGYPTVDTMDGVKIYHHDECLKAKALLPVKPNTTLPPLIPDNGPLTPAQQFWRRLRQRLRPHIIK